MDVMIDDLDYESTTEARVLRDILDIAIELEHAAVPEGTPVADITVMDSLRWDAPHLPSALKSLMKSALIDFAACEPSFMEDHYIVFDGLDIATKRFEERAAWAVENDRTIIICRENGSFGTGYSKECLTIFQYINNYNNDYFASWMDGCESEVFRMMLEGGCAYNSHNGLPIMDAAGALHCREAYEALGGWIFGSDMHALFFPAKLWTIKQLLQAKRSDFDWDSGYFDCWRAQPDSFFDAIKPGFSALVRGGFDIEDLITFLNATAPVSISAIDLPTDLVA